MESRQHSPHAVGDDIDLRGSDAASPRLPEGSLRADPDLENVAIEVRGVRRPVVFGMDGEPRIVLKSELPAAACAAQSPWRSSTGGRPNRIDRTRGPSA